MGLAYSCNPNKMLTRIPSCNCSFSKKKEHHEEHSVKYSISGVCNSVRSLLANPRRSLLARKDDEIYSDDSDLERTSVVV